MKKFWFVIFYLAAMIGTYYFSAMGSNSWITANINPHFFKLFFMHIMCYAVMMLSIFFFVKNKKLYIFTFLACVFDLFPGINAIPLVPTVLNIICIIMGFIEKKDIVEKA